MWYLITVTALSVLLLRKVKGCPWIWVKDLLPCHELSVLFSLANPGDGFRQGKQWMESLGELLTSCSDWFRLKQVPVQVMWRNEPGKVLGFSPPQRAVKWEQPLSLTAAQSSVRLYQVLFSTSHFHERLFPGRNYNLTAKFLGLARQYVYLLYLVLRISC